MIHLFFFILGICIHAYPNNTMEIRIDEKTFVERFYKCFYPNRVSGILFAEVLRKDEAFILNYTKGSTSKELVENLVEVLPCIDVVNIESETFRFILIVSNIDEENNLSESSAFLAEHGIQDDAIITFKIFYSNRIECGPISKG